jgi:hypothetical protein
MPIDAFAQKEVPGMLSVRPDTPHDGCRVDDELGIGILQRPP